ncbi:uncharacterized protein LOC126833134 [Adelges cooleyi]|uniref:uncharacterized protein LOC126833134 n=1 Tax=Adelges cooleyi TaxID=133065 RepID=UPI00217F2B6A|nr:uncharacterized protein LOC126833134 [Adelges cooleyi]
MSAALRDSLDVNQKPAFDESITKRQYHSYQPYSNVALGNNDEIRIAINQQDLYTFPAESYLYMQGTINKPATVTEEVLFVNNGAMFLFDEIRYELNSIEIDKIRNPGITTTIKGYISIPHGSVHRYQNAGWDSDGNITGSFELCIPLSHIFGYAEDHRKLIINARQDLILHRAASDVNALKTAKDGCTVTLNKLLWRVPHVHVSDTVRLKLLKTLDSRRSAFAAGNVLNTRICRGRLKFLGPLKPHRIPKNLGTS